MKEPEQLKKLYESTPIPPALEQRVEQALATRPRPRARRWQKSIVACAACFGAFVLSINLSPAFAASLYDLPLVGPVAKLLTFQETHQVDDAKDILVRVPQLTGTGNSELEKQINQRVSEKIEELKAQATQYAQEYLDAYNQTKAPQDDDFWRVEIDIDYALKHSSPGLVSFCLSSTSSAASVFTQQLFYNIDLNSGADLTLADLLGPEYIALCNSAVEQGMAKVLAQNPDAFYYNTLDEETHDDEFAFRTIAQDQPFYINEAGNPVVVFEKYQIAPGFMGIQEFEVPLP